MTFVQLLSALRLPLYLLACLLLGGASAAGHLANGILQIAGLLLIGQMLYTGPQNAEGGALADGQRSALLGLAPSDKIIGWLLTLFIGWLVLQIIPLPSFIWHSLPGRDAVITGDGIMGIAGVWRPISMQPGQTLYSALSLIPPVAILMLAMRTSEIYLRFSVILVIAIAIISTPLGLMQLSQGAGGPAYFYDITNANASVGFFANSNHLATLYLLAMVFVADLPYDHKQQRKKAMIWRYIRLIILVFLLISLVLNRSLAGLALTVPVLIYWGSRINRVRAWSNNFSPAFYLVAALLAVALSVGGFFALSRLGIESENLTQPAERLGYYINSLKIGWGAFPFGTGQGTFRWVYNLYEDWQALDSTYVNHAHSDFVEFFMENGLVALIILSGFLLWFARRTISMINGSRIWAEFMAPAAMAIVVIAGHSLVDYPIRTSAIAAIFALSVGILVRPLDEVARRRKRRPTI